MKQFLYILFAVLLLTGCEEVKEAGDETAREITGSNMIQQGKQVEQKLHEIERQQQQHMEQLNQQ